MCRLFALTSDKPQSPMVAVEALNIMREGHDGSGMGLLLRDLSGPFTDLKNCPILSGIFTEEGLERLDDYMQKLGFINIYTITTKIERKHHLIRVYKYPGNWNLNQNEKLARLLSIRLELRNMGAKEKDIIIFSFWPDTIMIKATGDPLAIADNLNLGREELQAKIIMAQGRQNTNYDIDFYACHPFFLQGYATMTNGENTAFSMNREFLMSRGFPGYIGYQSDSEVFTHILHYTMAMLKLDLPTYKHIITPLSDSDIVEHKKDGLLKNLKQTCRNLIIDGPNCVIGLLPDNTVFMVQDKKKLRPGVVGGQPGYYAFSSEICGLDAALPERNKSQDFQPMYLDTVIVGPGRERCKYAARNKH